MGLQALLGARNEFDEPVAMLFQRVEWDERECGNALRAAKFVRWIRIEFVRFGFDRAADPAEGPAAKALGDEAFDVRFPRGCKEDVGSLRAQPVGGGKGAVEMP